MQLLLDQVKKELGPDAVILNSRRVREKGLASFFKKRMLEVMVAYEPEKTPAARRLKPAAAQNAQNAASVSAAPDAEAADGSRALAMAIADSAREQLVILDQRIGALDGMMNDFVNKFSFVKREVTFDYSPEVAELLGRLVDNQVREELAHRLARGTEAVMKKEDGTSAVEVMEYLIAEEFGAPETIQHKKFTSKVVLVMGPTGAGKTTSIAKLAASFSIEQRKKVGIINTDTYRIGAQEQMRTYADIMDIPVRMVYNHTGILDALSEMDDRDIIFIDTAGKRPDDAQHKEDIANIVRLAQPEEVLLCIPASISFGAAKEVLDNYKFVDQLKLLITKIDETRYHGMILNISWYAQKPLSYVTTGQNVPDDIAPADVGEITRGLLRGR
jgi:flagellar biosynthesis protein FlhF